MDKWDRATDFNCYSCMYFVPKIQSSSGGKSSEGRCRAKSPTLKGFPVVYADFDWCGEHKIGSNPVRDAKEEPKPYEHPMGQDDNKPLTKEDVRKVLDEPLPSPVFDQPLVSTGEALQGKPDDNRKKETITAVYPVDLEEKAEIKAEINKLLDVILCANNQVKVIGNKEYLVHEKTVNRAVSEIQELLKKL